jgi:integrase
MTEKKRIPYKKRDGTTDERKPPGKRIRKRLDEDNVKVLPCKRTQYMVWDRGAKESEKGLHVLVSPGGARTYRSLYYFPGSSTPHGRKLGRVGVMTLQEAREACRQDQRKAWQGHDPRGDSLTSSAAFKSAVEDYVKRVLIGKKENVTAHEARRAILKACEAWYDRTLATIRPEEIQELLELLFTGDADKGIRPKRYMANAVYSYLKPFFAWCAKPGINKLSVSPMLGIDKPWGGATPRMRVYNNDELNRLWSAADKMGGVEGPFLKLALLTGKRRGHLVGMRWNELEEKDGGLFWTPPPGRKYKRNHPIPLSKLAARVLSGIRPKDMEKHPHAFPGRYEGKLLGAGTKMQKRVQEASGIEDWFLHACRHTVETKLAELRVAPHVRDLLLDHASKRGSGAGYDHWEYRDEMREAVEKWADHVERLVHPQGVKALR